MSKIRSFVASIAVLAGMATTAFAQDDAAASADQLRQFNASLHYQTGTVPVANAHATFQLDGGFRYLPPADTRRVLEDLWGNPPDDSVLGMLVPGDVEITDPASWAVVLTYSGDGHVSDDDAAKIDYSDLLKSMQDETADGNAEREKAGYGRVDLIGWAAPPRYDADQKKLHWAKELAFGGSSEHTVNYDIRALGREGYLSMNAVGSMSDISRIQSGMTRVLNMVSFDAGHRYADFNESTDKVAEYGLAALIGGVAASKLGLFAKLGLLLIKLKKVAILLVVGAFAAAKRLFGRKDENA